MEASRFQGLGDCRLHGHDMGVDLEVNDTNLLSPFVPLGLVARLAGLVLITILLISLRSQKGQQATPDILALDPSAISNLAIISKAPPPWFEPHYCRVPFVLHAGMMLSGMPPNRPTTLRSVRTMESTSIIPSTPPRAPQAV